MVTSQRACKHGFTIVEIVVMITITAILVTMVSFAFGSWRVRTAKTEVKASLTDLSTALNNELNFNNKYPSAMPSTYTPGKGVTMTYSSPSPSYATYCASATSKSESTVKMYISSSNQVPSTTSC